MEVVLIKKAKYNLDEEKYTPIPGDVFEMLVDTNVVTEDLDTLPKVIMFESRDDYVKYDPKDIDFTKDVYISKKGQIFCFLKTTSSLTLTMPSSNATNTKEDKGK